VFVIIGYVVVIFSVFGGFMMAGGHLAALLQPIELLMIGGAAFGAFLVGNDMKTIKATVAALPTVLAPSSYSKALYLDLLAMMFEFLLKDGREWAHEAIAKQNTQEGSHESVCNHDAQFIVGYLTNR
jgi:flagellar motor component MotA